MSEHSRSGMDTRKRTAAKPPAAAERLLLYLLPESIRDNVSGDLSEIFNAAIVPSRGHFRAGLWYWWQVLCSAGLFFRFRKETDTAIKLWKGRIHMQKPMDHESPYHPGISMHHIPVGGGVAGLLFVLATVFIFCLGIPAFRQILAITVTLGILASAVLYYWHKRHALKIQTLDLHKQK